MVLSLQQEVLPKTLHAEQPSQHIDWENSGLSLLQQARPWPRSQRVRRAGVSSFGISGTNAHVVLEEAPRAAETAALSAQEVLSAQEAQAARTTSSEDVSTLPLLLSAQTEEGLRAQAQQLADFLEAHPDTRLADVAYSAALRRSHFPVRASVFAEDLTAAGQALRALALDQPHAALSRGLATSHSKLVFVFPGQGSQWLGMGRALMGQSPIFRDAIAECDRALAPFTGWSMRALLEGQSLPELPPADRVDAVQPALFAIGVALARVWQEQLGVTPSAVLGHSQGEVAAAVVAGWLSLEDGARVVAARSRAVLTLAPPGAMLMVELPAEELALALQPFDGALSIAAINTKTSAIVSGDLVAADALLQSLSSKGVFCRKINVDYASHSAHMDALLPGLEKALADLRPLRGRLPFYSTVFARPLTEGDQLDAQYWCKNLRDTVRFEAALDALALQHLHVFVELSPHPVLALPLATAAAAHQGVVVGSLLRDKGDLLQLHKHFVELHNHGVPLPLARILPNAAFVELPTYPFQRTHYWLENAKKPADAQALGLAPLDHPILGAIASLAENGGHLLSGRLHAKDMPWLLEHAVFGIPLFPGAGSLELVLCAARALGMHAVKDLTLQQPLRILEQPLQLQLALAAPDQDGLVALTLHSRRHDLDPWLHNASATIAQDSATEHDPLFDMLARWDTARFSPVPNQHFYTQLQEDGLFYGPTFQGLGELFLHEDVAYASVRLPDSEKLHEHFSIHPALLDAALHTLIAAIKLRHQDQDLVLLPFSWNDVSLYATGARELRVAVRLAHTLPDEQPSATIAIADASGAPLLFVRSLALRPVTRNTLVNALSDELPLYALKDFAVELPALEQQANVAAVGMCGIATRALALEVHADIETVSAAREAVPDVFLVDLTDFDCGSDVLEVTRSALDLVQRWLSGVAFQGSRLVFAVLAASVRDENLVSGAAAEAVRGVVRTLRTEHPERDARVVALDRGWTADTLRQSLLLRDEPDLLVSELGISATRLCNATALATLTLPPISSSPWSVEILERGRLDRLEVRGCAVAALRPCEVRVGVRASGVNFRDVLNTLDMVPAPQLGLECAGQVLAVGSAVTTLSVGDRVMGLCSGSFGSEVVVDARLMVGIPRGISYAEAATIPVAYLTALYAFEDLAELRAGQSVLIHAAAGGVGMAAVQLARSIGAQVHATASRSKWPALHALGLNDAQLQSSRDLSFAEEWRGRAFDVVLNALSGEYIDASLGLLQRGGRFIEMGKTDVRDAAALHATYGVQYAAFELMQAGPERIQSLLRALVTMLEAGSITPLPFVAHDVRDISLVFREMAQGKHVGKRVLTVPAALDPERSVLITGGTGELGRALAKHLVAQHGVRHLWLLSRQGAHALGADLLADELRALGALSVTIDAVDVADQDAMHALLARIERPLTGVFHLAGVLDDGLIEAQTPERLARVFTPKAGAARVLHDLTLHHDLAAFVLFSSAAGVFGGPGQSTYAAANAYLDALALARTRLGLPAHSLAWGLWQQAGIGMTARLGRAELARLAREGIQPMPQDQALRLFDRAVAQHIPVLVPVKLDLQRMQRELAEDAPPPILRALLRPALRKAAAANISSNALKQRLSALPEHERTTRVLDLIQAETAAVLGLALPSAVPLDMPLQKLGLDSLMAVELKNRLAKLLGLKLPSTFAFDYPTPKAMALYAIARLFDAPATPAEKTPAADLTTDATIAIIAMACKLPGGIDSPDAFWNVLRDAKDVIQPFPQRWDALDVYDPNPETLGKSYAKEGGFVQDVDAFDAAFFGISPREARSMDPQQRLVMETSWEALERAGIAPASLNETATGVYLGSVGSDYRDESAADLTLLDGFRGTGSLASVISGRVAYALGLQGPALTIDTACSSSLVALHLACNALRSGECHLALAGGVTVMSTPGIFVEFSRLRGMSPTARCKSFSDDADGAIWSEGCGILVLKRLSDAQRDGDRVLALIRGSAVNQDGRSQGLTAPNGPAQQRVIQEALSVSGLSPSDIDAIEAHGTGTTLGDPIEAGALASVFGAHRTVEEPVYLGSSKSNLGHAQAAAGVAGVIKMVLSLQQEVLPKTLHAEQPSQHIDWENSGLSLLQQARPWPRSQRVRRAGVSSFGISGTNAHVVLEEAPKAPGLSAHEALSAQGAQEARATSSADVSTLPLLLSAQTEEGLRAQAQQLADFLEAHPDTRLADVAYSAALRRSHFPVRASVFAEDLTAAGQALRALALDQPHAALSRGLATSHSKLVFVFPGQGSQWLGMGRALLQQSPIFRDAIAECDRALAPFTGWSMRALLEGQSLPELPPADRVDAVQPALFAIGVALARVWQEQLGVTPSAVLGHSQGEVAAAVVAGWLSLEDGARVVAARSRAVLMLAPPGAMLMVELPAEELTRALQPFDGALSIAAINTKTSAIVSGDLVAADALLQSLSNKGVFCRKINVDYASHSAHMDALLPGLEKALADLRPKPGHLPFYSTVFARPLTDSDPLDAQYWCKNLRDTVRFEAALDALALQHLHVFVELSPHPVLALPLATAAAAHQGVVVGSLLRDKGDLLQIHKHFVELHNHGVPLPLARILPNAAFVELPTYPFQRTHYWLENAKKPADAQALGLAPLDHPILGAIASLAENGGHLLSGRLHAKDMPWLLEHAVFGIPLFPGAGSLELVLCAARALGMHAVKDLTLQQPLRILEQPLQLQLALAAPDQDGLVALTLHSRRHDLDPWLHNASATIAQDSATEHDPLFDMLARWDTARFSPVPNQHFYTQLQEDGLFYGPTFQGLGELFLHEDVAYASVRLPDSEKLHEHFSIHPALLDAALHTLIAAIKLRHQDQDLVLLPFSWNDVSLYATGARELRVAVRLAHTLPDEQPSATIAIADASGAPLLFVRSLALRPVTRNNLVNALSDELPLYALKDFPVEPHAPTEANLLVLGSDWPLALLPGARHVDTFEDLDTSAGNIPDILCIAPDYGAADANDPLHNASHALGLIQRLLSTPQLRDRPVVWLAQMEDNGVLSAVDASVQGLIRSVRSEHTDMTLRHVTLNLAASSALVRAALIDHTEPELTVHEAHTSALRLSRAASFEALPARFALRSREPGNLDAIDVYAAAHAVLLPNEVRVRVRAAGVNFRDVLGALDMVHADVVLGSEFAGVVSEVGSGVHELAVGDRVMGMSMSSAAMMNGCFGTETVADTRALVRMPRNLRFAEAATLPVAYMTAHYAFSELACLTRGQRVLVHAGAGGVGMAAIRLAQALGCEVFATAHRRKWPALRAMGLDDAHIASSRDLNYADTWRRSVANPGLDVVLNALAHEHVDASLALLRSGGVFLEMGKTDIRDAQAVAQVHSGVRYLPFSLPDAGLDRIQSLLRTLVTMLDAGSITPLPFVAHDVRDISLVFREMAQGKHVGKRVLTVPAALDPALSVLITGGTGELGRALAKHLVAQHGVRHLWLLSRQGAHALGADLLADELRALGALSVTIDAVDVADRDAMHALLARSERPLTGVFHLAGVLDDGLIEAQTPERLARVFTPKAGAARVLHDLTLHHDLAAFVLFSSAAGVFGGPGQSTYAAANAYLDALALARTRLGLPAHSLAWGLWQQAGIGMTARLGRAELARLAREGIQPMPQDQALRLFDRALAQHSPVLVPVKLDLQRMQRELAEDAPPPILRALLRPALRKAAAANISSNALKQRLAALPERERTLHLRAILQQEVAAVLGVAQPSAISPDVPLQKLGLDSLMAVEIRNRLGKLVGRPLPATFAFDHPTLNAIGAFFLENMDLAVVADTQTPPQDPDKALEWALRRLTARRIQQSGLLGQLLLLAAPDAGAATDQTPDKPELGEMSIDDIRSELADILGAAQ